MIKLILKRIPNSKIIVKKGGVDRRDYRVSFEKVEKELNFKAKYSVQDGIDEIINIFQSDQNKYLKENALLIRGNFNILEHVK